MLPNLTIISSIIVLVFAQNCRVPTIPNLNGVCPAGYVLVSTTCCPSGDVVLPTRTITAHIVRKRSCKDLLNPKTGQSDCPARKSYCSHPVYRNLMEVQCPFTCGYCSGTTSCFDRVHPRTGVSDCPRRVDYCKYAVYVTLMKEQCPKTCGYC
ncbi:shTK domain protein [Dictyocaulus viviparus]|uniref:ShTK domain protein n=1 Tax=Dictyocaulus viviparus TaxID=29172 RepID=A0A0D8XF04_DICVI|nr:shTK domain protein [Dictyocaulus viviparus]